MGKRSVATETLEFALAVVQRIPVGRSVTTTEIKAQLDGGGIVRDVRSVQRMMETLAERFPEIECDKRSKPYGYRWSKGAKGLSIPNLSLEQALVLQLAENYLKNLLPQQLMQSMGGFFEQARRNLEGSDNSQLERQWPRKVRVVATSQPLQPPKIADGVLEAVSKALYENCYLELDYRNAQGKTRSSKVMPLGLAQQGPRLYLVCRFEGFENERILAVNRIHRASASTLHFERPKNFDLEQYDADGSFGLGHGQRVHLGFSIASDMGQHLVESPLAAGQTVEALPEGWLRIKATVPDTDLLTRWLRGFGDAVRDVERTVVVADGDAL